MGKGYGRRYAYDGEEHTIEEWAAIVHLPAKALYNRFARGWTIEDALTLPIGTIRKKKQRPCKQCEYHGHLVWFGDICCDYLSKTGHARTVENGVKVDKCPYINATNTRKEMKDNDKETP